MSAVPQVAVLGSARTRQGALLAPATRSTGTRTTATVIAFALLALYGTLRWSTMLAAPYSGRTLGLVALALAICLFGATSHSRRWFVRVPSLGLTALTCLAMFPASGIPMRLILHHRIERIVDLIGHGLGSLPGVVVPYQGPTVDTADVIRLGAGMLLLGAALTVGTSRSPRGEARLAAAALPLVVLATIPSCLARPQVPYLHGCILFLLLAGFVFSERLAPRPTGGIVLLGLAAVIAVVLTPRLDLHRPWIDFSSLAGGAASDAGERFDWSQTYGRLTWPRDGATVLEVTASRPYYWKAEDLDGFNGRGWVIAPGVAGNGPVSTIKARYISRWTQTLRFTVEQLHAPQIITAGMSQPPLLPGHSIADPGSEAGTYTTDPPLHPGESYTVTAYTPKPSVAELADSGAHYPASLGADLAISLPGGARVAFPGYGSRSLEGVALRDVQASEYRGIYALAQHLRAGTSSPYAYVRAVRGYLGEGFTYTLDPRPASLPLVSFLLNTRAGYCQQFAGAMALLLRMEGVPARVAVGFTTGAPTLTNLHEYTVSDVDAHAWVEAWFPRIGWVKFDPTPAAGDQGGSATGTSGSSVGRTNPRSRLHTLAKGIRSHSTDHGAGGRGGASGAASGHARLWPKLLLGVIVLLSLGLGLLERARRRGPPAPERLVAELERAFARAGRPLGGGVTLQSLEGRFADAPEAAAYIRTVRSARYAESTVTPTGAERRALRTRLRRGLGPLGPLRALLALPPRL